jgi:hypothetical protein
MNVLKLKGRMKSETTNLDLIRLAKLNDIQLDAVLYKDHLHLLPNDVKYIILNMSDSDHRGTHWMALALLDDMAYYFDSFGMPPPQSVIQFCSERKIKSIYYNTIELQHINSGGCGEYSLWFLHQIQKFIAA